MVSRDGLRRESGGEPPHSKARAGIELQEIWRMGRVGVSSCSKKMKTRRHVPIAPGKTGAWVCLVAVMLLWAPLWATAWQSDGMDCCKGGMCMAHGHSKPNAAGSRQTSAEETPMQCGHHGGGSMADCSMTCCHQSSPDLKAPAIFVMPNPARIDQPLEVMSAAGNFAPTEFLQSFEPLSPPPRTPLFSL